MGMHLIPSDGIWKCPLALLSAPLRAYDRSRTGGGAKDPRRERCQ